MANTKQTQNLDTLSAPQRERLEFIDFRLFFLGDVSRSDLVEQFRIGTAAATRDFSLYKEFKTNNMEFDWATKSYVITDCFSPLFEPNVGRVLRALSRGFTGSVSKDDEPLLSAEYPPELSPPITEALAVVSRAIHREQVVQMKYCSITSGWTERQIVPHSLVDNGTRWHVRAFDRRSNQFRDFVFTRIKSPSIVDHSQIEKHEQSTADNEWTRIVELVLVPHPQYEHVDIIKRDFQMDNDNKIRVQIRAAEAGYLLRRWMVDCSPDHGLNGLEYQLWLEDPLTLYGVNNLRIAPGYEHPRGQTNAADKAQQNSGES